MLPTFKDLQELIKKGATLEAQQMIAELREVDLQRREEIRALHEEVLELREKLKVKAALSFDGSRYWLSKDGPFCATCQDRDGKLIRLQAREPGAWRCNCCDGFFPDNSYKDPGCTVIRSNFIGW